VRLLPGCNLKLQSFLSSALLLPWNLIDHVQLLDGAKSICCINQSLPCAGVQSAGCFSLTALQPSRLMIDQAHTSHQHAENAAAQLQPVMLAVLNCILLYSSVLSAVVSIPSWYCPFSTSNTAAAQAKEHLNYVLRPL
jgi:hypothetical protein